MELREIIGFISALLIGLSLGLMGGGGSILTLPVMVYLLRIPPVTATAYSLFVVGATALLGGIQNYRIGRVDIKSLFVFAIPSSIAIFLTRKFILHAIPDHLFYIGQFLITKEIALMLLFGILMIYASISMIKSGKRKTEQENNPIKINYPIVVAQAVFVGFICGLLGAGGGFMIIPALVFLAGLPMKRAVGTSLVIIAINSFIGFMGDNYIYKDWTFLFEFTFMAAIGMLTGIYFSKKIKGYQLRSGFGWFILILGVFVILEELLLNRT